MNERDVGAARRVLDPRSLGRPVHMLERFTSQIRVDLGALVREKFNRRYQANFEIREVALGAAPAAGADGRWFGYAVAAGNVGFSLDRNVLLRILGYRYGAAAVRATAAPNGQTESNEETVLPAAAAERETSTEERLAVQLGREFVAVVTQRIEAMSAAMQHKQSAATPLNFTGLIERVPNPGAWILEAVIAEPAGQVEGKLRIFLDEIWSAALLKGLAPARARAGTANSTARTVQPVASRLRVTLVARLLEKEMTVGAVSDMRVGDVIPVSLGASDVLIEDARLFRAALTEHQGKLWLTSFEDVE